MGLICLTFFIIALLVMVVAKSAKETFGLPHGAALLFSIVFIVLIVIFKDNFGLAVSIAIVGIGIVVGFYFLISYLKKKSKKTNITLIITCALAIPLGVCIGFAINPKPLNSANEFIEKAPYSYMENNSYSEITADYQANYYSGGNWLCYKFSNGGVVEINGIDYSVHAALGVNEGSFVYVYGYAKQPKTIGRQWDITCWFKYDYDNKVFTYSDATDENKIELEHKTAALLEEKGFSLLNKALETNGQAMNVFEAIKFSSYNNVRNIDKRIRNGFYFGIAISSLLFTSGVIFFGVFLHKDNKSSKQNNVVKN